MKELVKGLDKSWWQTNPIRRKPRENKGIYIAAQDALKKFNFEPFNSTEASGFIFRNYTIEEARDKEIYPEQNGYLNYGAEQWYKRLFDDGGIDRVKVTKAQFFYKFNPNATQLIQAGLSQEEDKLI